MQCGEEKKMTIHDFTSTLLYQWSVFGMCSVYISHILSDQSIRGLKNAQAIPSELEHHKPKCRWIVG